MWFLEIIDLFCGYRKIELNNDRGYCLSVEIIIM